MRVRILNERGIAQFRDFLQLCREGQDPDFANLAIQPSFSSETGIEISKIPSLKKHEVAAYLFELLKPLGHANTIESQVGLWAWLTLNWIDDLAPKKSDGSREVKSNYRWIPESDNFRNYYRHMLALPYRAYSAHPSNPEIAAALLAGRVGIPGELTEQIASSQEIFANASLLGTASKLYVDTKSYELKPGAGGNGPGSPRRYAAVVNQLILTYDVSTISPQKLLTLLPPEFDRFKN